MPAFLFWHEIALPLGITLAMVVVALSGIKTVARFLERRHEARMAATGPGGDEVEHLKSELGQLRAQVDALEERLDFTERLLTQERSRRQVEPGRQES